MTEENYELCYEIIHSNELLENPTLFEIKLSKLSKDVRNGLLVMLSQMDSNDIKIKDVAPFFDVDGGRPDFQKCYDIFRGEFGEFFNSRESIFTGEFTTMSEILKSYQRSGYSMTDEIGDMIKNLSDDGYKYLKESMVDLELYEDVVEFDKLRN